MEILLRDKITNRAFNFALFKCVMVKKSFPEWLEIEAKRIEKFYKEKLETGETIIDFETTEGTVTTSHKGGR